MYDDIKKPQLLKNIPMGIIRALPVLYYYSRYAESNIPEKPKKVFLTHLDYLLDVLLLLNNNIKTQELSDIINDVKDYKLPENNIKLDLLEKITEKMSILFNQHKQLLKSVTLNLRDSILDIYKHKVFKTKVLLVNNNNEQEKIKKLNNTLHNFCNYETEQIDIHSTDYAKTLLDFDVIFFVSTYPPQIHAQVKDLQDYKKPGIASAFIEKEGIVDRQAIRHGAQLMKEGFPVLFKVFTPIRLFTSIDKIYMMHYLTV